MELLELNALVRKTVGNGPARALRREGRFPAVFYGPQTDSLLLSVNIKEFEQTLKQGKSGQVLVNLVIQNGERITQPAMLKELQSHSVSGNFLHADFYQISMDRKIKVMVPVTTRGKSEGIELGGLLQIIRRQLEISCLPHLVPETIEVDITDLNIGDSVHLNEIQTEDDIEILADTNFTVLTITAPTKEEEEEVSEEEELEEGEEEAEEETSEASE